MYFDPCIITGVFQDGKSNLFLIQTSCSEAQVRVLAIMMFLLLTFRLTHNIFYVYAELAGLHFGGASTGVQKIKIFHSRGKMIEMVKNDGKRFSKIFKIFKFSDSTESGSPDSKKKWRLQWSRLPDSTGYPTPGVLPTLEIILISQKNFSPNFKLRHYFTIRTHQL